MTVSVCLMLITLTVQAPPSAPSQKPTDVMHIEGRKNPELIPEWSVWQDALRIIAGGSRQLPSHVLEHTTKQEEAFILREADQQPKRDADCKTRLLALKPDSENPSTLIQRSQAIKLQCRWGALHARDRILAALSPAVRTALLEFVESVRAATTVDILRRDLAFFLQPQ